MNPDRLKPKHAVVLDALMLASDPPTRGELMELVRGQTTGSLTLSVLAHAARELCDARLIDMHAVNQKRYVYKINTSGIVALRKFRREERAELQAQTGPGLAQPWRIDKLGLPALTSSPHFKGYCRNDGNKHIPSVGTRC